jgi:UDP-N-acetylglucosamine diphosphorylase/glucosamine-1-phosphate N-acetyltransferase
MNKAPFTLLLAESLGIEAYFYPFTITHSSWELFAGCKRIFEIYKDGMSGFSVSYAGRLLQKQSFFQQEHIIHNMMDTFQNPVLVLRAEILPEKALMLNLRRMAVDGSQSFHITDANNNTIGIYLVNTSEINELVQFAPSFEEIIAHVQLDKLPICSLSAKRIEYIWQIIPELQNMIEETSFSFKKPELQDIPDHIFCLHKHNIILGEQVKLMPGTVLDASEGPIIMCDNVQIMPHSFIQGPCFIGKNSIIKAGSQIYGKTIIGPYCKIGGEIENSVFHGYSNKQHSGFIGHSYIGEWVNLGAMTTTSDLKNTYGSIEVSLNGTKINTNMKFLGLICGDHTKTAIGTLFSTGTIIGVCSSIHKPNVQPSKEIPSFSWGEKGIQYMFEKAIQVAEIVMARRGKALTEAHISILESEYKKSSFLL